MASPITEEAMSRYAPGGFHPVRIGDAFDNGKYRVLSKLGYGVYSTVWLAHNAQTKQNVAIKILTADTYDGERDPYELAILGCIADKAQHDLRGSRHVLGLLDDFRHDGPHGQHMCLVFEPMGPHLGQLRNMFPERRLPVPLAKKLARELVAALAFLHDTCGVIHTDIKPTNILIETPETTDMLRNMPPEVFQQQSPALPPPQDYYMSSEPVVPSHEDLTTSSDISFRVADFGTASWKDYHLSEWIQPEKLRAPEVILGGAWDSKADIWNLGLVIWELATGQLCFDGQATATAAYSPEAHLTQMQVILGRFPETLLSRVRHRDSFFDAQGNLTSSISFPSLTLEGMCAGSGAFAVQDDMDAFVAFVKSTLALEPQQRPDARELLDCRWLKEGGPDNAA